MLTKLLPDFKEAGVTHIGLENFDHAGNLTQGVRRDPVLKFLGAARDHGIEVVGIDLPYHVMARAAAKRVARDTGRPVIASDKQLKQFQEWVEASNFPPEIAPSLGKVMLTLRNRFMARRLSLAQGRGKAVVLAGNSHVKTPPGLGLLDEFSNLVPDTLADHLARRGRKPFSLSVIGGIFKAGPQEQVRAPLYSFVKESGGNFVGSDAAPDVAVVSLGPPGEVP
jgi:hypothetical protein